MTQYRVNWEKIVSAELFYVEESKLAFSDYGHEGVLLLPLGVTLGACTGSTWQRAQMCEFVS